MTWLDLITRYRPCQTIAGFRQLRLLTIAALSPNFTEEPDRQGLPAARLLAI